MSDWVKDENNEQVLDESGNWIYASDLLPDKPPPPIASQDHFHGLQRKKISNEYQILIDHDACVSSEFPTTNYGSSATLGVLETSDPYYVYVYIKATDLANFTSGHTLDKGFLNLKRMYEVDWTGYHSQIEIRRVSADWDESTITWNTKAAEAAEYSDVFLYSISQDEWVAIDLKDWLQNWIDGTWSNYGLVLKAKAADPIKKFRSSEYATTADRPFFSLFYFPYD